MDYTQELITTIHDYSHSEAVLEPLVCELSQDQATAVLIPALFDELQRPALQGIKDQISRCTGFVHQVVVCLYANSKNDYQEAVKFFGQLPQPTLVIWENGPRVKDYLMQLQAKGLDFQSFRGKGLAVWLALGVASIEADLIVLHDADITSYSKSYLIKLLYPLLEREFGLAFTKAYYARLGGDPLQMYGRVVRLFVTPLLTTLNDLFGYHQYLRYLMAYRYPLSGEFALRRDLALNVRVPCNWGLEIAFLAEVYRNVALKRIAQVDLGVFEHKHQAVGHSPQEGLRKMCHDVLRSLLRTFTELEQVVLTPDHIRTLQVKYRRIAQDLIQQFAIDSRCNGFAYNRHLEEQTVEQFEQLIPPAGKEYFMDPSGLQIPTWNRVMAVVPTVQNDLKSLVLADMRQAQS
ncbi:glucosyl-3-phosphoglycerate synthase [Lyngbya confervoides]|uniref:Glucosyl-3-phosphoglycerate synthase n=1 Tax=Lyngbya confervoides BDU141951 TaxID=1574623 RepID=A0ABD4T4T2_9CYAN|nr:glucosyl-3-phosphoglycerate synthase [Lyngbya confervoides]MCM1983524.1 glucosyl-3-phosphoglycerate synthase [Lyngbya confervoides BDU141951]